MTSKAVKPAEFAFEYRNLPDDTDVIRELKGKITGQHREVDQDTEDVIDHTPTRNGSQAVPHTLALVEAENSNTNLSAHYNMYMMSKQKRKSVDKPGDCHPNADDGSPERSSPAAEINVLADEEQDETTDFERDQQFDKDNQKRRKMRESEDDRAYLYKKYHHRDPERNTADIVNLSLEKKSRKSCLHKIWSAKAYLVPLIIAVMFIVIYVVLELRKDSALKSIETQLYQSANTYGAGVLPVASKRIGDPSSVVDKLQKNYLNIGLHDDDQIEECQGPELKHSFPDIDYALLGYNIIKGFPLAVGHDPGFTYPIFIADYSTGAQTADCHYSIPHGLVVIPDVSCVTSFSSTTVQNKYEFAKALSVSANIHGRSWGVRFSASFGYKQSSSEMSTGESVFILSTANCNYYFSKLITKDAPKFDEVFLKWVYQLDAANSDPELYFDFFETYGTHFLTEVTFGARYTYEYKMDSKLYETKKSSGVNVAAQASYSGFFSVGGGFSMDSQQRQAASEFSKSVTTKTITVGAAPPPDGDVMTWASQVKTSPVPTEYKLSSIENLFTDAYMGHLKVDYNRLRKNIETRLNEYCLFLLKIGQVETCEDLIAGIEMPNTRLYNHYRQLVVGSITNCIETCLQEVACEATTFCESCNSKDDIFNVCYLFKELDFDKYADKDKNRVWQSNVFPEKIKTQIGFNNTGVIGIRRGFERAEDKNADIDRCKELCIVDAYCVAYSHCDCPEKEAQCQLFSKQQIKGLFQEIGTLTFFITNRSNAWETTTNDTITNN